MDPAGKRASSSGSACRASTVSSPSSRSSRSTSPSSVPVSRTRSWLDGSCPGTLSRAGVVRYGPWTRKPRNVSFSVGKDTISGELSTGTRRPASTRKAISTGGASSSARRCQASHSSAVLPSLDSVTRRGPGPPAAGHSETDRSMTERPHRRAPDPQPPDAPQEQQDPGLDRGQRRRDLPGRDRGGHGVVVEGEDEQRPGRGQGQRLDRETAGRSSRSRSARPRCRREGTWCRRTPT